MAKIIELAQERSQDNDFGHTMDHIILTVELSKYLAAKEGADEEVCTVAACLHDIAKNNSKAHGLRGAEEAGKFLAEIGAPDPFVDQVCYAISQHDNDLPKRTIEAKVLWDADKLQSVGPLGFARIFANRLIYSKQNIYYAIEQAKYWEEFFQERFYTDTGRSAAMKLNRFMEEFFSLCDAVRGAQLDQLLDDGYHLSAGISDGSYMTAVPSDHK